MVAAVHCLSTERLDATSVAAATAMLSAAEQSRLARLAMEADRRDYAVSHALLRRALAIHGGRPPEEWTFEREPNGKPQLTPALRDGTKLTFNLAHTKGLVACAVTSEGDVGVDVEASNDCLDVLLLARGYFSSEEIEALENCSGAERQLRFVEQWVLKEAYLKATGEGISSTIDQVSFAFVGPTSIRASTTRSRDAVSWWFALYEPAAGYRLALAVRRRDAADPVVTVRFFIDGAEGNLAPLRSSSAVERAHPPAE
jgi:4'-phosphopantetheinyl transferase